MSSIETILQRWTRRSNHRRTAELALALAAWLVAVVLMVYDVKVLPVSATVLASLALTALGAATALLVVAIGRYRAARTDVDGLARTIDRGHEDAGLVATALAVERGAAIGDAMLGAAVVQRARALLQTIEDPSPPLRVTGWPWTIPAMLALVLLAGSRMAPPVHAAAEAQTPEPVAELSPETLEQLRDEADKLAELARRPGLSEQAQRELEQARRELEKLHARPDRALAGLSRADRSLSALGARLHGEGVFDRERLDLLALEQLVEAMQRAAQRGENETAAALAEALARRLAEASGTDVRKTAQSLEQALSNTRSQGGAANGADALEGIAQRLQAGDSGLARSDLKQWAQALRRASPKQTGSLQQQLESVQRAIDQAQREGLAQRNGEDPQQVASQGSGDTAERSATASSQTRPAGDASGQMKSGANAPGSAEGEGAAGRGGTTPGGAGRGDDAPGASGTPPSLAASPERVAAGQRGRATGAIRAIARFSGGAADMKRYEAVHRDYQAAAEAAIHRESVPLTRRDYIRRYFEAVRASAAQGRD